MTEETKAEKQRRQARERKQRQCEREEALGVRNVWYRLAAAEREAIQRGAQSGGYEDEAEYILELVDRDLSRQGLRRLKA